jgi:hypothetical protein
MKRTKPRRRKPTITQLNDPGFEVMHLRLPIETVEILRRWSEMTTRKPPQMVSVMAAHFDSCPETSNARWIGGSTSNG